MKRALALAALAAAPPAAAQGFDPFHEARIDNRIGAQVPLDAPLTDASGHPTSLRAIGGGKPILLAPVQHHCPNLCGVTLAGLSQAVARQGGTDFAVVAFGIDPGEGADAARDDLASLPSRGGFHAVVAPQASIRAVTDAIGYRFAWDARIRQFAHAAGVAVLTSDGRLSGWLHGVAPQPEALRAALERARAGTPARWSDPLLLLCYHYDPSTGRYTLAITRILQLAALATLAALAMLWVRLRRSAG